MHGPQGIHKENNREVSAQESVGAKKFLYYTKLFRDQKFVFEAQSFPRVLCAAFLPEHWLQQLSLGSVCSIFFPGLCVVHLSPGCVCSIFSGVVYAAAFFRAQWVQLLKSHLRFVLHFCSAKNNVDRLVSAFAHRCLCFLFNSLVHTNTSSVNDLCLISHIVSSYWMIFL